MIEGWLEFEAALRQELGSLDFRYPAVVARIFQTTTHLVTLGDVVRLALVLTTGAERDSTSTLFERAGFRSLTRQQANWQEGRRDDYAFTVDLAHQP